MTQKFYSISFNLDGLTDEAVRMLEIADKQDWWTGLHQDQNGNYEIDVIDYDSLGSNDTLSIRVKSNLSYRERCKKYGMSGLETRNIEKESNGKLKITDPFAGTAIPTDEHIERIIEVYGEDHQQARLWSLRDASSQLFGHIKGRKLTGSDAMNEIAREFWEWCADGDFSPVIPRGRGGGRKSISTEPTKRTNISLTQEDKDYLSLIGDGNVSRGIRVAIEAHQSGSEYFVQKCTDDWLAMMENQDRWNMFEGKMAAAGSFPIGINADDERVTELSEKIRIYHQTV